MKIEQLRRLKSVSQGCVDMREAQMRADMNRTQVVLMNKRIEYEAELARQSLAAARTSGLITQVEQPPKREWFSWLHPHGDDRDL